MVELLELAVSQQRETVRGLLSRIKNILSKPLRTARRGSILKANKRSDLRKDTIE